MSQMGMVTDRVRIASFDNGQRGSRKVVETALPRYVAFALAWRRFWYEVDRAWMGARYEWRKARKISFPYSAKIGVTDPILEAADGAGMALPEDDPKLVLYRTESGMYFTDSHMKDQQWCEKHLGGMATFAVDITEQRAEQLVEQMDALDIEVGLTENDRHLRDVLRRLLRERDAY